MPKKGAGLKRPGQALRGSSEFHAWGDSNLYLTRCSGSEIRLTIEHRAEQACEPVPLKLTSDGDVAVAHLEISRLVPSPPQPVALSPEQQLLNLLSASAQPLRIRTLREQAGLRHETVSLAIAALLERRVVEKTDLGYRLVNSTTN